MYGLVNNGVQTFVVANYGEEMWNGICASAGLDDSHFESMMSYDDAVTYGLVGAICEHLDMTAHQVLEVFGQFWVGYARETSVGKLMEFQGNSLFERLRGLDEMHDRVRLAMPHLEPPSFEFEEGEGDTHRLHYHSHREGLQPMVIGLLQGLAAETGDEISVRLVEGRAEGHDHDVFEIRMIASASAGAAA